MAPTSVPLLVLNSKARPLDRLLARRQGSLPFGVPPAPLRQPYTAPPPLLDLLDWRVPYVLTFAMICVSLEYARRASAEGLRAPPRTALPSPNAPANGATSSATSSALARIQGP